MLEKLFYFLKHNNNKIAVVVGGEEISYKKLGSFVAGVLEGFVRTGLQPGDRILVNLPNSLDYLLCYLAAMWGGYTIVPINQSLPQEDKDYIIELSKPDHIISSKLPESRAELISEPSQTSIFMISFTSGTTNKPKSVCHTLNNMVRNVADFNNLTGIDEQTVMLHVLPMGYMAGFLNTILSPLIAGGTVVIAPQFSALTALNFWEPAIKSACNTVWLTPTMLAFLTKALRDNKVPEYPPETRFRQQKINLQIELPAFQTF